MFRSAIATLLLSGVVAIALLGVPACGGGGGGGGGGGQSIPVTLLDVYDFSITNTASVLALRVAFDRSGDSHIVAISHAAGAHGSFDTRNGEWTFNTLSRLAVNTDAGPDALFGAFELQVDTPVVIPENGPPTTGSMVVIGLPASSTVEFVAGGVNLRTGPGVTDFYSWADFEALMDSATATPQEQIASFGMQVMLFMVERYTQVVDALYEIEDTDDLEAGFNPRSGPCEPWPTGYTLVPDTIPNPADYSLLWNDVDFSGSVDRGDDLYFGFFDCRPDTFSDYTYDGGLELQNLNEIIDAQYRVLQIGITPSPGRDGGAFFTGLRIWDYDVDDGAMTVTREEYVTVTGAFSILFAQP